MSIVVIEGADGVGKTTLCGLLSEHYKDCVIIKFPYEDNITKKCIDQILSGKTKVESHTLPLLFSSNRWNALEYINSLLEEKKLIIFDRFIYSGIVYSMLGGNSQEWSEAINSEFVKPDLILYLENNKLKDGDDIFETPIKQAQIIEIYKNLFNNRKDVIVSKINTEVNSAEETLKIACTFIDAIVNKV